MKTFDVQAIEIHAPFSRTFSFLADPGMLTAWAHAFETVAGGTAVMRTPQGSATVILDVEASRERGTVDWHMTFPDGARASAYSRLVALDPGRCAFAFVLTPPPLPLEQLEGALEAQSRTLAQELRTLKELLENGTS